jgi:hypothetical protein
MEGNSAATQRSKDSEKEENQGKLAHSHHRRFQDSRLAIAAAPVTAVARRSFAPHRIRGFRRTLIRIFRRGEPDHGGDFAGPMQCTSCVESGVRHENPEIRCDGNP